MIRTQPNSKSLCTIEAIALSLSLLEDNDEIAEVRIYMVYLAYILLLNAYWVVKLLYAPINVKILGGRPGIGGGFELRSVFLFKYPAPGKSSWVKKLQLPHSRVIIVGQKNSTNDQKSLPQADL